MAQIYGGLVLGLVLECFFCFTVMMRGDEYVSDYFEMHTSLCII